MTKQVPSNTEVAAPFIRATIVILSTMAGISATVGKPTVKKTRVAHGDVSAIVGVTGDKVGSIAVSFSKTCATSIVRGMLGDDIQDLLQDVQDAVGEIANMVSGQARAGLAEMGITLQGSTPTVVLGENHTISHMGNAPIIAIPFSTNAGDFTVEFCLQ